MRVLPLGPTVLMYHGFHRSGTSPHDPYDLSVADDDLRAQLRLLAARRWAPLDLDGYLRAVDAGGRGRSFLVTIDDALRSVAAVGAPVLAAAGVPAVLFAPPGLLGATTRWLPEQPGEPLLTPDELRGLVRDGMETGVHGWDHASMKGMTDAELHRSVVEARDALADVTGVRPRAFAYPYGDVDDRAVAAVAAAGYDVGFSVYRDHGRHAVSRTDVKPSDSLTTVRLKLLAGRHYRAVWRAVGAAGPLRRALRARSDAAA